MIMTLVLTEEEVDNLKSILVQKPYDKRAINLLEKIENTKKRIRRRYKESTEL